MDKQKNESNEYSLQRYHIIEGGPTGPNLFWRKYFTPSGSNVLFYIFGKAHIQEDILYLDRYDGYGKEKRYNTIDKLNTYIQSLPKWNKTKYYVRDDDPLFEILICKTGKPRP
jgi:hypothetical protein